MDNVYRKGLLSTLYDLDYSIKKTKHIYAHEKPELIRLRSFLLTFNTPFFIDKYFREVVVGEGPICSGEYWGQTIDYFPKDKKKDDELNEQFINYISTVPFGYFSELH